MKHSKLSDYESINDNSSNIEHINPGLDYYGELCFKSIIDNGLNLRFINKQSNELCSRAIIQNKYALRFVKNKTFDLCMEAINQHPYAVKHVEEELEFSYLIYLHAVRKHGLSIKHIKNKTYEL